MQILTRRVRPTGRAGSIYGRANPPGEPVLNKAEGATSVWCAVGFHCEKEAVEPTAIQAGEGKLRA
jgi:hypothetical protein